MQVVFIWYAISHFNPTVTLSTEVVLLHREQISLVVMMLFHWHEGVLSGGAEGSVLGGLEFVDWYS